MWLVYAPAADPIVHPKPSLVVWLQAGDTDFCFPRFDTHNYFESCGINSIKSQVIVYEET